MSLFNKARFNRLCDSCGLWRVYANVFPFTNKLRDSYSVYSGTSIHKGESMGDFLAILVCGILLAIMSFMIVIINMTAV